MKCAVKQCHNEADMSKNNYFVIPTNYLVPNCYVLCSDHKDTFLDYYYFFDDSGKHIYKKETETK